MEIFAIPKPFDGHVGDIQWNAVNSWKRVAGARVTLFGDEPGVAEVARDVGVCHVPGLRRNRHGTPLVSDAFIAMRCRDPDSLLCYVNADILLSQDAGVHGFIALGAFDQFLMVGRRTDVNVKGRLDFSGKDDDWLRPVKLEANLNGRLHPPYGIDYFITPARALPTMIDLPVGRGFWDNWFVYNYIKRWLPVVDATPSMQVFHQNHDYSHVTGGRQYITYGAEVQENVERFGTDFVEMGIVDATHVLRDGRVRLNVTDDRIARAIVTAPRLLPIIGPIMRRRRGLHKVVQWPGNRIEDGQ